MPAPVVAGIDGSAESLAAAAWAAHEAERRNLPLHLVHAWNWHPRRQEGEIAGAAQRHRARTVLRRAEERVRAECPDVPCTGEQTEGPATAALLKAVDQADLMVLGSRGLSGFTGLLVGSVALGVVAKATRPVVLVRADEETAGEHVSARDDSASTDTGHRDVVLAVDLGEACDEVIGFAFEAARLRRARLRAVHAWHTSGPVGLGPGDVGLVRASWQGEEWLDFLKAVLRTWRDEYPDVEVMGTVVDDKPSTALVRAAAGAGLLVVGHRLTERPLGPRTGPVTHAAVHHVGCPVAVVPHF
ncbi:universal stress protein [Streptomyces triticiradicis]|uniref:Universal stress protein n=1 Tax=Streptomyces triticiradicis TaxID=2651189 RepID=A0A7J5DNW1_9ACTN|nr:universal stress protein [Streptomyces triticiradicis]KAB1990468.1 universal stress protein [Streptomyces triticiradicis]